MRPRLLHLAILFLFAASLTQAAELENRLAGHPSPYLALHGNDPVHWQSWDPALRERALAENKLLFISVGYFACHWCHVMQRESFQNDKTAALLNSFTIPIKVDRELRPALDAQLIDFVQRTRGHAGWPLNVFVTPRGHPLLGLTYLPPERFAHLLRNLQDAWADDADKLQDMAAQAASRYEAIQLQHPVLEQEVDLVARFEHQIWSIADEMAGGFGNQTKFPNVPQFHALLRLQQQRPAPRVAAFLELSMEQMATLGLRDHLGGGFFRYTTDPNWRVPHFEKMLYDNAQLMTLYVVAARVLKDARWLAVAEDTWRFLQRDMRSEQGGYIASLSAVDDVGNEGGHYLWHPDSLREVLDQDELTLARALWSMHGAPPHEGGHLPLAHADVEALAEAQPQGEEPLPARIEAVRAKLMKARAQRPLPKDGKRLAAWNGLLLQAMVDLAQSTEKPEYRRSAQELGGFIMRHFYRDEQLYRAVEDETLRLPGTLEDYAQVAAGLWHWAHWTQNAKAQRLAVELHAQAWQRFYSVKGWRLSEADLLAVPVWEGSVEDGALVSPVSTLLQLTEQLLTAGVIEADAVPLQAALQRAKAGAARATYAHASYLPLLWEQGQDAKR